MTQIWHRVLVDKNIPSDEQEGGELDFPQKIPDNKTIPSEEQEGDGLISLQKILDDENFLSKKQEDFEENSSQEIPEGVEIPCKEQKDDEQTSPHKFQLITTHLLTNKTVLSVFCQNINSPTVNVACLRRQVRSYYVTARTTKFQFLSVFWVARCTS